MEPFPNIGQILDSDGFILLLYIRTLSHLKLKKRLFIKMASRSRSLNELPGHLRVPILKRKDTERTQRRLEAGVAGMEELRELKERQQQLMSDTMEREESRHRLRRRHGDASVSKREGHNVPRSPGHVSKLLSREGSSTYFKFKK